MMKSLFKNFLLIIFMGVSLKSYAWNALGHKIIADIAYQHVSPTVRVKLDNIVQTFLKEYPQYTSFTKMSIWADAIRGQKIELFTHWHYIDLAFSSDGTPLKNLTDTDNAVWALNTLLPALKYVEGNPYDKARFLALLEHIVGDLHQPLHAASRISASHPDGDKGGNLFSVRTGTGSSQAVTLHKYWDEGAGLLEGEDSDTAMNNLAHEISSLYPETFFGDASKDLKPEDWTKESFNISFTKVYNTPENQVPSRAYVEEEKKIVEQQLALAGYRLANLLNLLLDSKDSN